jgi:hypothetical protein
MPDFWISFRIKHETLKGRSYDARYGDMIDAIESHGSEFWDGDTSMIAVRTTSTIGALGLDIKRAIDPSVDRVVIREIGRDNTRYIGDPGEEFLTFFPNAKKL